MKIETEVNETMTEDEKAGIAWWNSLPDSMREFWVNTRRTDAVIAEAWDCFKRHQAKTAVNQEGKQNP
jgi:hypothetical protein